MKHRLSWFTVLLVVLSLAMTTSAIGGTTPGDALVQPAGPEDATGCVDSDHTTGPGQNVYDVNNVRHWAGVIYVNIPPYSAPEIPTFCTDLTTTIHGGDCFQTAGSTACPITWLLNNGYEPSSSLSNAEAAARQAAVWYFSDGFDVRTSDPVYARTQEIINAVPSPCVLPASPPLMTIDPPSAVNFLPGGTTHTFILTVTQDGNPRANQVVNLSTDFGTLDPPTQVTTDSDGHATFTITGDLPGTAHITASFPYNLPAGTRFTKLPGAVDQQVIVLGTPQSGNVIASAIKTWQQGTVLIVHKFNDLNMNGVQNGGEESLSGWTIRLYRLDGATWTLVGSKATNSSGNATWNDLAPGTYRAEEVLQAGWLITTPPNPSDPVVLVAGSQEQINFGNVALAVIKVWKFNDLDMNGTHSADEPVLDGWTMNIDPAVNGIGAGVTSNGYVAFIDLDPNTYHVWETEQARWRATTPTSQDVTVAANDFREVWFGNVQIDMGDLPASYGMTRMDQNGARHRLGNLMLGQVIDSETNGQCCSACGGDDRSDLNPTPPVPDDEDGVVPTPGFTWTVGTIGQGKGGSLDVTVTGGNGYINGWIDWNGNGNFADAGERVLADQAVAGAPGGHVQTLNFDIPDSAIGLTTFYARFRLCEEPQVLGEVGNEQASCATLDGLTFNGEVEDYRFEMQPLAVVLIAFDAQAQNDHILVSWETASEINNQGFNLYRSTSAAGPEDLLDYIPSQGPGSPQGFQYAYQDFAVESGQTYYYWLESVDLYGGLAMNGPVSATYQAPTTVNVVDLRSAPTWPLAVPLAVVAACAMMIGVGAAWLRQRAR